MRKMATVRQIDSLSPIEGADRIELAHIGGWQVIVRKGAYKAGDLTVYCEIDSWIPHAVDPTLTREGHDPKEYEGVKGQRLKTAKMRGVVSQGLCLPLSVLPHLPPAGCDDVSEILGIIKWEKPLAACLRGQAKGNFPTFIPKTDQERVQNIKGVYQDALEHNEHFEVTYKLDGSSMTIYRYQGSKDDGVKYGVCSRNIDLKTEQEGNAFVDMANKMQYCAVLDAVSAFFGVNSFAIQGELVGPNIQSNHEGVDENEFYIFDMFDIEEQRYLLPDERAAVMQLLECFEHIKHVPIYCHGSTLPLTVEECIKTAEGESGLNGKMREGLVFKSLARDFSFKVISNAYLLKHGD